MSRPPALHPRPRRDRVRLSGVDWRTYSHLLRIFDERPGWRLTYDRGELEIMSPSVEHENDDRFLARMVMALTEELDMPIKEGGSVTMRRRGKQRGLEPDDCFWIANAARMAGRRRLDLRTDPPPDLALEVDVTHSSLDRLSIYRALRVPEVWRLDGDRLTFHVLSAAGEYELAAASRIFLWVKPADLLVLCQT
jgi:Uma2 family endonuclease